MATRLMRKHKIRHIVVTHEKQVIGIIGSFDLLEPVESRRFAMKNPAGPRKRDKADP